MADDEDFFVTAGVLISSPTSDYSVQNILGSGAFGEVAQCLKLATNETVALKVLKSKEHIKEAKREAVILAQMKDLGSEDHHIVRWKDAFTYEGRFCLEFEKLDISLGEYFWTKDSEALNLSEIRPILYQLAVALKFLKSAKIIHADLKPQNIMMVNHSQQPPRLKVIDFGLAFDTSKAWMGAVLQTLWYRSPEILLGGAFDEGIDVWSLGCIAAEMWNGSPLFPGDDGFDMMRRIVQTVGEPPEHLLNAGIFTKTFFHKKHRRPCLWQLKSKPRYAHKGFNQHTISSLTDLLLTFHGYTGEDATAFEEDLISFVDLVSKMLAVDPSKRINPSQILEHPFLTLTRLIRSFDNSLYVKTCVDMMNIYKDQNPDNVKDMERSPVEKTSSSSTSLSYDSFSDDGHPAELSGQQSIIKRGKRDDGEASEADSSYVSGPDTPTGNRRRPGWMHTNQHQEDKPARQGPRVKDGGMRVDSASPLRTKKRRSTTHQQELSPRVDGAPSSQQLKTQTLTSRSGFDVTQTSTRRPAAMC